MVEKFVDLSSEFSQKPQKDAANGICGHLHMEFHSAVQEGDGDRVIAIWKYRPYVNIKSCHRTNNYYEAFNILSSCG